MAGGRISGGHFPKAAFSLGSLALLAFALSPKALVVDNRQTIVTPPPPPPVLRVEPAKIVMTGPPTAVAAERRVYQARIDAFERELREELDRVQQHVTSQCVPVHSEGCSTGTGVLIR